MDTREATYAGRRTDGAPVWRPISPHLQAYDMLQMSSALSIMHRITGVILGAGTLLLVWWLAAAATGPSAYASVAWFIGSPVGYLLMFGWTAALFYHLLNGIRHLAWDLGYGFAIPAMYASGWATLAGTGVLTVLAWIIYLIVG
jgi:succinate dehydrogenase / fumarate reductase cytochrome b subunit